MIELIPALIIDSLILITSILLVKKIKPNKNNLLNLAFGTFWLGVAGIYLFAGLCDLSGVINSTYISKLFFMITIALAAVPVFGLALFLSATYLKKKSVWILPVIFGLIGIVYIYFVTTSALKGPLIGWVVKYSIGSHELLILSQYAAYGCFTMIALLALTAFRARKTSTFIQFNSVALSMGLFFLGGYLDLLGNPQIQTLFFRLLILAGVFIGFIGFSPGVKLMKLANRLK
ncbi:hypothetical protein KKG83_08050 [Candidatus Micrarchaeota archaeon]|nr:hypothetical protein [Candidatus Micrarchaeota archaeon]MBU2477393.1 hypothetical protein [Candidatus Micrarchaeota archaeon]